MHTKDFLAQELDKAGLKEMAEKARAGFYHDFLSPLDFPDSQLDIELAEAVRAGNEAAEDLRRRHHNGEFDASVVESEEWAQSPEGQAALGMLLPGKESTEATAYAWREIHPTSAVFSVAWIIDCPWAHPLWNQYWLALYDLTSPHPDCPPTFYLPDATHEFVLFALSPDHPVAKDTPIGDAKVVRLIPPNLGYQFKADSNETALARVQGLVDQIVAGRLSPDTDFRRQWDRRLPDAHSLTRR